MIDKDDYIRLICEVVEGDTRKQVYRYLVRVEEEKKDLDITRQQVHPELSCGQINFSGMSVAEEAAVRSRAFIIVRREITFPIVVNQFLNVPY